MRLAARLDDGSAVQHYLELAQQYSEGQICTAYSRALKRAEPTSLAWVFHRELERREHRNGHNMPKTRMAAIRIDRRSLAVAILTGAHLEYTQPRQLSSSPEKATLTAATFIGNIVDKFQIKSAALETIPNGHERRRTLLHQAVRRVLIEQSVSMWDVPKSSLLDSFAWPAVRFRKDLRAIASGIYPVLNEQPGRPWTQDAAVLGLFVQTERLFNNI